MKRGKPKVSRYERRQRQARQLAEYRAERDKENKHEVIVSFLSGLLLFVMFIGAMIGTVIGIEWIARQ
jgi:hypothetical protein